MYEKTRKILVLVNLALGAVLMVATLLGGLVLAVGAGAVASSFSRQTPPSPQPSNQFCVRNQKVVSGPECE